MRITVASDERTGVAAGADRAWASEAAARDVARAPATEPRGAANVAHVAGPDG